MNKVTTLIFFTLFGLGCGETTEECMTDSDCNEGETCVITHDHEGDDHDHGGTCEESESSN